MSALTVLYVSLYGAIGPQPAAGTGAAAGSRPALGLGGGTGRRAGERLGGDW